MWEDDLEVSSRRKLAWLVGIVAAVALLAAGWYWYRARQAAPAPAPVAVSAPGAAESTEGQIAHPMPGDAGSTALPALNDSDQVAHDSLAGVIGREPVERFLVPQNIVRHIVVTVDNLPRRKVAIDLRPIKAIPGQTVTAAQGDATVLSPANYARYAALVKVIQNTDAKSLALVYQRLYPLFQQSYEDLGYPGKYFNDRLVEVIDHLLQTPEPAGPVLLTQPKVFWEYADPGLEQRSAGQRLLLRMGPENERAIKAKLREFRAEIVKKN
ncbi:MAG TPA: DUF3014 domain-containing protein [Steroidobacteraceae bacterium]|nr:DUF3014 domain-containing protein [Steroidobacteraceae bacterium]